MKHTLLCTSKFPIMDPMQLTTFSNNEESRSTIEDHNTYSILRSKTEEKKQRRRREWQRQQERERQHEKLKQQKILEYERKRAQALKYAEEKSSRHSQSKNSSESPSDLQYRDSSTSTVSFHNLHKKLDGPTSKTVSLFRGPENQINTKELRRIKVNIYRNIPIKRPVTELQRNIVDLEDVIIERKEGEGRKPIFDRNEIKNAIKTEEEHIVTYHYNICKRCKKMKRNANKLNINRRFRKLRDFRYRETSNEHSYERQDSNKERRHSTLLTSIKPQFISPIETCVQRHLLPNPRYGPF